MLAGYGKILDIDLTPRKITTKDIEPEFVRKYLGGVGFGCKLVYDKIGLDVDPLSPENIIVFANGPLTGSGAPSGNRTEITTKHPLTDSIGTGNTGGVWGSMLKQAGYDIVVIRGRAEKPVYLQISESAVEIKNAGHLWGKDSLVTTDILSSAAAGKVAVIAIGQAGENLVRFACPLNDKQHAAGRCGAGAVMGSKNLKAIAVQGAGVAPSPARPDEFSEVVKQARQRLIAADDAFWKSGPHVPPYTLATTRMDGARSLSQEEVEKYVVKRGPACYACPVRCYNGIAEVKQGKYVSLTMTNAQRPAIIGLFGGVCGIDNLPAVWKCKDLCNRYGMDFYSAAGVIAFAIELFQQGIIGTNDVDGLELAWGNEDAIIQILHNIANRKGFADVLAEGSVKAAKKIGRGAGKYPVTIKGMETGGHDPRPRALRELNWQFLGNLTNPRGGDVIKSTHHHGNQYNPAWWADKYDMLAEARDKIYGNPPQQLVTSWEGQAHMYKWFEDLHSLVDAAGMCFVASHMRIALGPGYLSRLYSAYTGLDSTPEELMNTAERLFNLFKVCAARHGMTRKDDHWPDRFYTESVTEGKYKGAILSRQAVDTLLDGYYDIRGWDKKTGLPTRKKLIDLGLADVTEDLWRK